MTAILRRSLFPIALLLAATALGQTNAEYLVEINPGDGSFEAIGGPMEDVIMVHVNRQCKDEVNGEYTFIASSPSRFLTCDIATGEVVNTAPVNSVHEIWAGFHCLHNCDTLITVNLNQQAMMHYVSLYDRAGGVDLGPISDSIPDTNPAQLGVSFYFSAFDPNNDLLYGYNQYDNTMYVMEIPSGNVAETHQTSVTLTDIVFDDVNGTLYGYGGLAGGKQLYRFNPALGDFEAVGSTFNTQAWGYTTVSIDGNNERMFISITNNNTGSYVVTVDLNTGAVLTDQQTMTASGNGPFGGPNTLNGLYFNSTDQFISLHWGTGHSDVVSTSTRDAETRAALIYPNPNSGRFHFRLDERFGNFERLTVFDGRGAAVYEKNHPAKHEELSLDLPAGHYTACFFNDRGEFERVPFVIR